MTDAPLAQPEFDKLVDKLKLVSNGLGTLYIAEQAADALATERALRVKAEQRIEDAPHEEVCDYWFDKGMLGRKEKPCNCWKSEENS